MAKIILKDGWIYRGSILTETDSKIVINDRKVGKVELAKDSIAVLSREEY